MDSLTVSVGVALGIFTFFMLFYRVEQGTVAIVTRFGKAVRTAGPGLHLKAPWIEWVGGRVDLRVQELKITIQSTTSDRVFFDSVVAIHYAPDPNQVIRILGQIDDPRVQMDSIARYFVQTFVSQNTLEVVYAQLERFAKSIEISLQSKMDLYGYRIHSILVTAIRLEGALKQAMTDFQLSQWDRVRKVLDAQLKVHLAPLRGEAEMIETLIKAEAESRTRVFEGQGEAAYQSSVLRGVTDAMKTFQDAIPGLTPKDAMNLAIRLQYLEMVRRSDGKTKGYEVFSSDLAQIAKDLLESLLQKRASS